MQLHYSKQFIIHLRKGNKDAFEQLYSDVHEALYGMAIRYVKDPDLAEDAVHDVLLNLWKRRDSLNPEKSLQSYLFTSLRNHLLNIIKIDARRISRHYDYMQINKAVSMPADMELRTGELKALMENGLDKLPEGKRRIYIMKVIEGFSNREIAEKLGISVHTVKSQFYKANEHLKQYIENCSGFNSISDKPDSE